MTPWQILLEISQMHSPVKNSNMSLDMGISRSRRSLALQRSPVSRWVDLDWGGTLKAACTASHLISPTFHCGVSVVFWSGSKFLLCNHCTGDRSSKAHGHFHLPIKQSSTGLLFHCEQYQLFWTIWPPVQWRSTRPVGESDQRALLPIEVSNISGSEIYASVLNGDYQGKYTFEMRNFWENICWTFVVTHFNPMTSFCNSLDL